jgi:hypothetical protein
VASAAVGPLLATTDFATASLPGGAALQRRSARRGRTDEQRGRKGAQASKTPKPSVWTLSLTQLGRPLIGSDGRPCGTGFPSGPSLGETSRLRPIFWLCVEEKKLVKASVARPVSDS